MPYASSYLGVQFLTARMSVMNAKDFSSTGTKKEAYWFNHSLVDVTSPLY